ncbi:hypothetical protein FRB93_013291 [Tulasnella sp. JGI-2019a]|nr:hypothetical protein FRB93_013291 [Tulasnella sp. JGI-2019a]
MQVHFPLNFSMEILKAFKSASDEPAQVATREIEEQDVMGCPTDLYLPNQVRHLRRNFPDAKPVLAPQTMGSKQLRHYSKAQRSYVITARPNAKLSTRHVPPLSPLFPLAPLLTLSLYLMVYYDTSIEQTPPNPQIEVNPTCIASPTVITSQPTAIKLEVQPAERLRGGCRECGVSL